MRTKFIILLSLSSLLMTSRVNARQMDIVSQHMIQYECPDGYIHGGGNLYVNPIINKCYNFTGKLFQMIRKNDAITGYLYIVMGKAIYHSSVLLHYGTYVKLESSIYEYYNFEGSLRIAHHLRKLY